MLAACLEVDPTVECGDLICAPGYACAGDRCVPPALLAACDGAADGAACAAPGIDTGACRAGVCAAVVCGDELVESPERCDDGNRIGGDGCSADCRSEERCGNGVVDPDE